MRSGRAQLLSKTILSYLAQLRKLSRAAVASRATSSNCEIARVQRFKNHLTKRTRMRTIASRGLKPISENA